MSHNGALFPLLKSDLKPDGFCGKKSSYLTKDKNNVKYFIIIIIIIKQNYSQRNNYERFQSSSLKMKCKINIIFMKENSQQILQFFFLPLSGKYGFELIFAETLSGKELLD